MDQTTPPATPPTAPITSCKPSGTVITSPTVPTPKFVNITALEHLKAFLDGLSNDVNTVAKDLWNDNKMILVVLIPLIAVIFGRNVLMSLIVSNAKKTITNATEQDAKLATQENTANTQADQLIKTADSLPAQEQPVTDADWYKKS